MAQEFTINSSAIESKINQLLPSQGGFGAGVDLSASTMVIPIVDLTETAEGSDVREDLQTAFSLTSISAFDVKNTTSTIINNTGYFRIFGAYSGLHAGGAISGNFSITDGTTTKQIIEYKSFAGADGALINTFDFTVFLQAGDSVTATTDTANAQLTGNTRQIADINGNLVDP